MTEREFPVLLMPTPNKKNQKNFALTREKQKKTPRSTKTPPQNNKNTKNTKKTPNFFFFRANAREKKRVKTKPISHPAQNGMNQKKIPLWETWKASGVALKRLGFTLVKPALSSNPGSVPVARPRHAAPPAPK